MNAKSGRSNQAIRPKKKSRGTRSTSRREVSRLTAEQECELAERISQGDSAARDVLVASNLRLAMNIAGSYPRANIGALGHDDLVQEGTLGLIRAAEDYNPKEHGNRFATYAAFWIHHQIQRLLAEQSTLVRLPYYLVLLRRQYERTRYRMIAATLEDPTVRGSVEPTLDEVAAEMGVEVQKLRHVHNTMIEARSCSSTNPDDDPSKDGSMIQELPPDRPLEVAETMQKLHDSLRKLTLLERWVIRRRFRMDGTIAEALAEAEARARRAAGSPTPRVDDHRTYRELARELGRDVRAIRQAEQSALAKLRKLVDPKGDEGERKPAEPSHYASLVVRRSA